jgi:hypothetical protein
VADVSASAIVDLSARRCPKCPKCCFGNHCLPCCPPVLSKKQARCRNCGLVG